MAPKKKTPEGWLETAPIKFVFPDARIVPFKTPLPPTRFQQERTERFRWTTFDLMDHLSYEGWPVGLVIDLSNKFPAYYDVEDFRRNMVHHIKLGCAGSDIMHDDRYFEFSDIVDKFLYDNQHNNKVVGVHCNLGINRTGYMICKYLINKLGYHPEQAIEEFAFRRGYPIERNDYLSDLRRLYPGPRPY